MHYYTTFLQIISTKPIDEIGHLPFIPEADDPAAGSYYPFLLAENTKLGIPVKIIAPLLSQASSIFFSCKRVGTEGWQDERNLIELEESSRVLMLLNPECCTAVNARKHLILNSYLSPQQDLALTALVFTVPKQTKSSTAWHHRRWILTDTSFSLSLVRPELDLCHRSASIYPKSYASWSHRQWVLTHLIQAEAMESILRDEYVRTREFINTHVSDHTAVYHLQVVLSKLKNTPSDHVAWAKDLCVRLQGHETIWCHLRWCVAQNLGENWDEFVNQFLKAEESRVDELEEERRQRCLAAALGVWMNKALGKGSELVIPEQMEKYLKILVKDTDKRGEGHKFWEEMLKGLSHRNGKNIT